MATLAPSRNAGLLAAAAAAAAVLSFLAGTQPELALALAGGVLILTLAFMFPTAHLTLILATATIVPYDLQNRFGLSAGGSAGIVFVDVLILAGLAWAAVRLTWLARDTLDRRAVAALVLLLLFFLIAAAQLAHGIALGRDPGVVGFEWRNLLGLAIAFIAFPLLLEPESRRRVFIGLVVVGVLLGVWGVAQFVINIPTTVSEDIGVREDVAYTSSGVGQIMGGRYAFPAVVVLSLAALISGRRRPASGTLLLLGVLLLGTVSLILTFQRAYWVATAAAVLLVVLRAGRAQRLRAIVWGLLALILVSVTFSAVAPGQATAVRERFMSLGQYDNDTSVSYRLIETRHVITRIKDSEIVGSGLGASIHWGRPSEGVPATTETYSHNAYLRTAWKLGIPAAVLLLLVLAIAMLGRRPSDPSTAVVLTGAKAALFATLVMGVTGPVFDTLTASAVIGVLIALAIALPVAAGRADDPMPARG